MNSALLKYIAAVVMFGSNGIVASAIDMGSSEIVLLRTFIGSVFLVAVFVFSRKKMASWHAGRHVLYLVVSGTAMGASWVLLFEAYQHVGVSIATLAYYCGPVLVMIAAPIVFKEALTLPKVLGFLAVVAGMVCVNGLGVWEGGFSWGSFCGLMAALMYAVMVISNKKATKITGLENAMVQLVVSCVAIGLFTFLTQPVAISIPARSVGPILILGVVNTGFGCLLYFSSIHDLSAQTVSLCGYLEPLSALVLSAAILGETLMPLQLLGAALILGGALFGEMLGKGGRRQRVGEDVEGAVTED